MSACAFCTAICSRARPASSPHPCQNTDYQSETDREDHTSTRTLRYAPHMVVRWSQQRTAVARSTPQSSACLFPPQTSLFARRTSPVLSSRFRFNFGTCPGYSCRRRQHKAHVDLAVTTGGPHGGGSAVNPVAIRCLSRNRPRITVLSKGVSLHLHTYSSTHNDCTSTADAMLLFLTVPSLTAAAAWGPEVARAGGSGS